MSEPFLGEIRLMAFNFAPRGWAFCDGQILPINQNQALFSLLGTTYGGDGRTSFALPDMRGRMPMHPGNVLQLGQKVGAESFSSGLVEVVDSISVDRGLVSNRSQQLAATGTQSLPPAVPELTLNFCIALQGLFPSRN